MIDEFNRVYTNDGFEEIMKRKKTGQLPNSFLKRVDSWLDLDYQGKSPTRGGSENHLTVRVRLKISKFLQYGNTRLDDLEGGFG